MFNPEKSGVRISERTVGYAEENDALKYGTIPSREDLIRKYREDREHRKSVDEVANILLTALRAKNNE